MSETIYKPLTPKLRGEINASIDKSIAELKTCNSNPLVNFQINAKNTLKNVINGLPDGYMIPFTRK